MKLKNIPIVNGHPDKESFCSALAYSKVKQLLTFFLLAYLISWIIWLPLYGHVFGQYDLPRMPLHHGIGGLGPVIAAFFTTWIFYKNDGLRYLLKRCFKIRPLLYLSIAFLSPFILLFIAAIASYLIDKTPFNLHKLLGSYLGITPEFLSKIRGEKSPK